jgi:hypothetical protein
MRHDVKAPDRARMLELARQLTWPRVILSRRTTGGGFDSVGPGVTAWYLFAEQFPADLVADATRALLAPLPTPEPTELEEIAS